MICQGGKDEKRPSGFKPDDLWKGTKLLARRGGIRARETAAGQGEAQAGAFDIDVSRNAHAGNVVAGGVQAGNRGVGAVHNLEQHRIILQRENPL